MTFDFKKWNISRVSMIPVSSTTPCYLYPLTVFSKLHDFCIVLSWVLHVIYNESKKCFNYPFKIHVPVHPWYTWDITTVWPDTDLLERRLGVECWFPSEWPWPCAPWTRCPTRWSDTQSIGSCSSSSHTVWLSFSRHHCKSDQKITLISFKVHLGINVRTKLFKLSFVPVNKQYTSYVCSPEDECLNPESACVKETFNWNCAFSFFIKIYNKHVW